MSFSCHANVGFRVSFNKYIYEWTSIGGGDFKGQYSPLIFGINYIFFKKTNSELWQALKNFEYKEKNSFGYQTMDLVYGLPPPPIENSLNDSHAYVH